MYGLRRVGAVNALELYGMMANCGEEAMEGWIGKFRDYQYHRLGW